MRFHNRFWQRIDHSAESPKEKLCPTSLPTEKPKGPKLVFLEIFVTFWTFRLLDIRVVGHSFFRPFSAFFPSRRQAHFLLRNRHSLKIIMFVLLSCGICKLNSSFKLQHICLEFLTGGTCGNVGLQIVFSYQLIYVWTQVTFLVWKKLLLLDLNLSNKLESSNSSWLK